MPSPHSIAHARTWPEQNGATGQTGRNLKFEISDCGLLLGAANLVQPFQEFHPLSPRIGGAAAPFGEIALAGDIGVLRCFGASPPSRAIVSIHSPHGISNLK